MSKLTDSLIYLKQQKWVDLTHTVTADIPYFQAFQPIREQTLCQVDPDGFFAKQYSLATQYGTHIDAPVHFSEGKRYLEEIELKELFLPLIVIHKEEEVAKNDDFVLSLADILTFEKQYGQIPADSFVAFASGWSKRWHDPESYYNIDENNQAHTPGWSLEALQFLHEKRQVKAIGHETLDTDAAIDEAKNGFLDAELYWLSTNKYQVEVLTNLNHLPATGSLISIGVPKIKAAPGFNVRAFAIVEE